MTAVRLSGSGTTLDVDLDVGSGVKYSAALEGYGDSGPSRTMEIVTW